MTSREKQVLEALKSGETYKTLSQRLAISHHTVKALYLSTERKLKNQSK